MNPRTRRLRRQRRQHAARAARLFANERLYAWALFDAPPRWIGSLAHATVYEGLCALTGEQIITVVHAFATENATRSRLLGAPESLWELVSLDPSRATTWQDVRQLVQGRNR